MNRVFCIYLFSSILLFASHKKIRSDPREIGAQTSSFLQKKKKTFLRNIQNDTNAKVIFGYVLGHKKGISKKIKDAHKRLLIMHLFTPSGLHFSSILLFFWPFFSFLKKRKKVLFIFSYTSICLLPFLVDGFFSIKRICLFQILKSIKQNGNFKNIENFHLFILTFLIDFCLGSFDKSPLSFSYSFLFLGLIFANKKFRGKKLIPYFAGAQVIISFFSKEGFYLFGIINSFLLTSIFSFLFPFWLIVFGLPSNFPFSPKIYHLFNHSMNFFLEIISFLDKLTQEFDHQFSSIPLILMIFLISSSISFKFKNFFLSFLLLIHSNPLFNFPFSVFKKESSFSNLKILKIKKIDRILRSKKGTKVYFKDGSICNYYLRKYGYESKCNLIF